MAQAQTDASGSSKHKKSRKQVDRSHMRTIGRWYIGETLGKGGYSWVKKGYDKKTGKCVALKFMTKADESWVAEQSKQVVTEIESLKQIRHQNVMKLYAYNLNARYPSKDEKTGKENELDTILLVLEYAPGGELFDILYYTSALEEIVARTYFRQIISGLEACHNAGVAHRDLKPQNLLLDSRFNIKITDFGLSKLFESDADSQMKTTYVGTRGYQAPELLLDKPYDLSCDVFSIGVVLFILMTGYPPFEQATNTDRWYKSMTQKPPNFQAFWKFHRASPLANNEECKDLIQKMLAFDPKERISIADIKKHPWYVGKFLEGKDLIRALRNRHREMESKRKSDPKKQEDLQKSIKKDVDFKGAIIPPIVSEDMDEDVGFLHSTEDWQDIYNIIDGKIGEFGGKCTYDDESMVLSCMMAIGQGKDLASTQHYEFQVQIYLSKKYNTAKVFKTLEALKQAALENKAKTFDANEAAIDKDAEDALRAQREAEEAERKAARKSETCVYSIRIVRTAGDELGFARFIMRKLFLDALLPLFGGVPNDRLGTKTKKKNKGIEDLENGNEEKEDTNAKKYNDDDIESEDEESDEEYGAILDKEGLGLAAAAIAAQVVSAGGADDAKAD